MTTFSNTIANIKIRFAIASGANVHALGYKGAVAAWEAAGGQVDKVGLRNELAVLRRREPKTAVKRAEWAERVAAYEALINE